MNKLVCPARFQTLLVWVAAVAAPSLALGDERFNVSIGARDALVISSPDGVQATIAAPTLAKPITVGSDSLQVSYGWDANGLLTAVVAQGARQTSDLHFNVLHKTVDLADHAIATFTFSPDLKDVSIDPGYVGSVAVNSQKMAPRQLADEERSTAPANSTPTTPGTSSGGAANETPAAVSPVTPPSAAPTAPAIAAATTPTSVSEAPAPLASQLLSPLTSDNSNIDVTTTAGAQTALSTPAAPRKLYWSEPVTPPNGPAPSVGLNEVKLIEVHGAVSVVTADGRTLPGAEGMIIPSGSTVKTLEGGTGALFMGGVDSARMLPRCELKITQDFDGAIRKVTIDLQRGAVFSRIGQRAGEKEIYEVRTAEGVEFAKKSEMLTFRGTMNDLGAPKVTLNSGLTLDRSQLLAWNPPVATHGLISDVSDSIIGESASTPLVTNTYIYYANPRPATGGNGSPIALPLTPLQIDSTILTGQGLSLAQVPISPQYNAVNVLQAIMVDLQPNNYKLQDLLYRENSGTGTPGDKAFYNNMTTVLFGPGGQLATIIAANRGQPNAQAHIDAAASLALKQDLVPFGTNPLTPY